MPQRAPPAFFGGTKDHADVHDLSQKPMDGYRVYSVSATLGQKLRMVVWYRWALPFPPSFTAPLKSLFPRTYKSISQPASPYAGQWGKFVACPFADQLRTPCEVRIMLSRNSSIFCGTPRQGPSGRWRGQTPGTARQGIDGRREQLLALFQPDTFQEIATHAKHAAKHFGLADKGTPFRRVIVGTGFVDGRPVAAFSQDFTVMGGTLGKCTPRRSCNPCNWPENRRSRGRVLQGDSAGARIREAVDALSGYGEVFYNSVLLSGVVPQIAIIAGPAPAARRIRRR